MEAPTPQKVALSNGKELEIWTFPTSRFETAFILNEILVSDEYFRHGVSIKPGDTVVDVGANIGIFGICALSRAAGIRYVAVEPAPPTFEALKANLLGTDGRGAGSFFDRNPGEFSICTGAPYPENILLCNVALSSECGTHPMTWFPVAPGNSTLAPNEKDKLQGWMMPQIFSQAQEMMVKVLTLEKLLEQEGVTSDIALLKVDVEGLELEVLKGVGPNTWTRIKQVVLEVHDCLPGEFDGEADGGGGGAHGWDKEAMASASRMIQQAMASGASGPPADTGSLFASMVLPGPRGAGIDGEWITYVPESDAGHKVPPPRDGGRTMQVCELLNKVGFKATVCCPLGFTANYSVSAVRA